MVFTQKCLANWNGLEVEHNWLNSVYLTGSKGLDGYKYMYV